MGFPSSLTRFLNGLKVLAVQEQSAFGLNMVPLNLGTCHWSSGGTGNAVGVGTQTGQTYYSTVLGETLSISFTGRRIGIIFGRATNGGTLSFAVDGVAQGTLSTVGSWMTYGENYIIATNLASGNHILTITKQDTSPTVINGYLTETAASGDFFKLVTQNYFGLNKLNNVLITSVAVALVTITPGVWLVNGVICNTTAGALTITLTDNSGNTVLVTPPIAANSNYPIPCPLYFLGGIKGSGGAAAGCFISGAYQN